MFFRLFWKQDFRYPNGSRRTGSNRWGELDRLTVFFSWRAIACETKMHHKTLGEICSQQTTRHGFWKPFKSKKNITTHNVLKVVMWNYTPRGKKLMYSSKIAKLELVHLPWKPAHSWPSSLWVHPKHQKPRYTDGPQRRFTNFGCVGFTSSFCFTVCVLIFLNLIKKTTCRFSEQT